MVSVPKFCRSFLVTALAMLILCSFSAEAKLPTTQLSISGPGLREAIHTKNQELLGISIWGGDFVDSTVVSQPESWEKLDVYYAYFWAGNERHPDRIRYVVKFAWDQSADRGLVYFPGPRDLWYRINTYSILRNGVDGTWRIASKNWGSALKAFIEDERAGSSSDVAEASND